MRYVKSFVQWMTAARTKSIDSILASDSSRPDGRELRVLQAKVDRLERRLRHLEGAGSLEELPGSTTVEAYLQERFESKTLEGVPNMSYFNVRFRDYEHIASNVKTLGYELARRLAVTLSAPAGNTFPPPNRSVSKLCTQADMESEWLLHWCSELCIYPSYHRKNWEFCYIAHSLYSEGQLSRGKRAIGFGCGDEPLPSLFAKYDVEVVATDQCLEEMLSAGWGNSESKHGLLDNILHPNICPSPERLKLISTTNLDMNNISEEFNGQFDFCWSSCALEHLGSIEKGLSFIDNSLRVLKPGGVAVHTTEFNMDDSGDTIDNWPTVLFQRKHMLELGRRLQLGGHFLAPLDFDCGQSVLDCYVDVPPYQNHLFAQLNGTPHLRLSIDGFVCSSFGIVIRKNKQYAK